MLFTQSLLQQQKAMPALRGVKDAGKRKEILDTAYEGIFKAEQWAAYGITEDRFKDICNSLTKALVWQVFAESAMVELRDRLYTFFRKDMKVYINNLNYIYGDYRKRFDRFGMDCTDGVLAQVDRICNSLQPYVYDLKKAILGQAIHRKALHSEVMAIAILAERLSAVAHARTSVFIECKTAAFPARGRRIMSNIGFRTMSDIMRTIRVELEKRCGEVDMRHAIRVNVTMKALTNKVESLKTEKIDGKYYTTGLR